MEEKRYCTLCKKEEKRGECSYGPEAWDMATLSPKLFVKNESMSPQDLMLQKQQLRLNTMKLMQQRKDLQQKKSIESPMKPSNLEPVQKEGTERINKLGKYYTISFVFRGMGKVLQFFVADVKRPTRDDIAKQLEKVYPGARLVNYYESMRQPQEALIYVDVTEEKEHTATKSDLEAKIGGGNLKKLAKKAAKRIDYDVDGDVDPNDKVEKKKGEYGEVVPTPYGKFKTKIGEDWQSVNRKDKTDGLSQKAVNAYRRENPGSKLQTAVTEKNPEGKRAKRRKSFCSRMKGMKKRLTSAETSRDPDSRINKALRRWNCN